MKKVILLLLAVSFVNVSCTLSQKRVPSSDEKGRLGSLKEAKILHYWSQLGPDNTLSFRLLALGSTCPAISIDGQISEMAVRMQSSDVTTSQVICEAEAPVIVKNVEVEGFRFPVLAESIERFVVIGDTGCRLKSIRIQNCKNPDDWPLEKNSREAVKLKPQFWIHTGDYSYREIECPRGDDRCEGLSTGPSWKTWEEDVLSPMRELFANVPVILARGNHESCGGFGNIWFQFFGPQSARNKGTDCMEASATMLHDVANMRILNIDAATDRNLRKEISEYSVPQENKYLWLLSHRPFLGDSPDVDTKTSAKLGEVLRSPGRLQGVFAGHTHLGSFIKFNDERPPELVLGNGGVQIDGFIQRVPKTNDRQIAYTVKDYGFALLEKVQEPVWKLLMIDDKGKIRIRCQAKLSLSAKTELQCQQ